MARFGDKGPYAVGNVRICTVAENHAERAAGITYEQRRKRSDNAKKQWLIPMSAETRQKISEAAKARSPITKETRDKMSIAQTARWARTGTRWGK
jgi:hypothetical protein